MWNFPHFFFLTGSLNNVLEYSMCRLMFLTLDFSVYHHFLNLEDGNVGEDEESPVDIAALALFFTAFLIFTSCLGQLALAKIRSST